MSLKVLVVDDHAVVREGIRAVLERKAGATRVAEAGDGAAAVAACRDEAFDVVVMDVSMPGIDGVAATRELLRASPSTRVLALSMHDEREVVQDMLRAGASGYLLKSAITEELVKAVDAVAGGGIYVGANITGMVLDDYVQGLRKDNAEPTPLSARERQVLQLVVDGKSAKEAAAVLGVSPRTVEMHRARLMQKLGVNSAAGLVRYALANGIVEP